MDDYFSAAIANVSELGDTDVFPLPVEGHLLHDRPADVLDLLRDIHANFDSKLALSGPVNESALTLVSYTSFRWVTQIDPLWNAYLLGLVLSMADQIESVRVPIADRTVFSYRLDRQDGSTRLFGEGSWRDFQTESLNRAREGGHVLICDIADFYARIYHHRLENALRAVDPKSPVPNRIMRLLSAFSNGTSYGLPVGGPAARILAELVLNRVDRLLVVAGVNFVRFADDYHIFADSSEDAYAALLTISELLLRNEGLTLQKGKTRILSSEEFQAGSLFAPEEAATVDPTSRRFLTLSLRYDPYSPTAVDDYQTLRDQVAQFDIAGMLSREMQKSRVSAALARRLLQALQFVDPGAKGDIALSLVDNIENLAPVFPSVMRALRGLADELEPDVRRTLCSKLRELVTRGSHLTRIDVNLAYLIRVLAVSPSPESEALLARLYDGETSAFVKRDIILIMAQWHAAYWLSDKKGRFLTMHAWVKRAFLIASYALGDEGRHWRSAVKPSLRDLDLLTLQWMQDRVASPTWEVPL